jgi:hypothetical protein
MPSIIFNTNRNNLDIVAQGKYLPTIKEVFQMVLTFSLTVLAWIFFRANNIEHALSYISEIFSGSLFSKPVITPKILFVLILIFILIEWLGREEEFALAKLGKWKSPFKYAFYYIIIVAIFVFSGEKQQFIYFQF